MVQGCFAERMSRIARILIDAGNTMMEVGRGKGEIAADEKSILIKNGEIMMGYGELIKLKSKFDKDK